MDSTDFSEAVHEHVGADITSGTVAESMIDAAICRDSEVMPTVLAGGGPGFGLDADTLDGRNGDQFIDTSAIAQTKTGSLTLNTLTGFGVSGYGPDGGGTFFDTNASGGARVGYGDYGIEAFGHAMGGRFEDTNQSAYAWVATGDTGILAYGAARAGWFAGNVLVDGIVESTSGGFKFPDGSEQVVAVHVADPPCFDNSNRFVDCGLRQRDGNGHGLGPDLAEGGGLFRNGAHVGGRKRHRGDPSGWPMRPDGQLASGRLAVADKSGVGGNTGAGLRVSDLSQHGRNRLLHGRS